MFKTFRNLSFIILSLSLVACASVPMESPEKDAAAKNFKAQPGKARIYVYRNEFFGAAVRLKVKLDGKEAGMTASETFMLFDVPPGKHTVASETESGWDELALNCQSGKVYYVWQEVKMGMFHPNSKLHLKDAAEGRKGVQECKLVKTNF